MEKSTGTHKKKANVSAKKVLTKSDLQEAAELTDYKRHEIQRLVTEIRNETYSESDVAKYCKDLRRLCDESIEARVAAGKAGAYDVLIAALDLKKDLTNNTETIEILRTLKSLMTKYPDLLDSNGISIMLCLLNVHEEDSVKVPLLQWIRVCCVMHEANRQDLIDEKIVRKLKALLENDSSEVQILVMSVLRSLVLDDDIRVQFGKSHDHARSIAIETLCTLLDIMEKEKSNEKLIIEVLGTISVLMVRQEFCKKVETVGGMAIIKDFLLQWHRNENVAKEVFKLIRALAGNDSVKENIIQNVNLGPLLKTCLNIHKKNATVSTYGLGAISACCLRSPENSNKLFDTGLPHVIIEIMKLHPTNKYVQKNASWAIRNMVSRSKFQIEHFKKLGVEEILRQNWDNFPQIEKDTLAALRDLELDVPLKEEWTGTGGLLTTSKQPDEPFQ